MSSLLMTTQFSTEKMGAQKGRLTHGHPRGWASGQGLVPRRVFFHWTRGALRTPPPPWPFSPLLGRGADLGMGPPSMPPLRAPPGRLPSGTSLLQEVVYLVSQGADPDEIGLMNIDEQLPVLEYPQPGLDIIKVPWAGGSQPWDPSGHFCSYTLSDSAPEGPGGSCGRRKRRDLPVPPGGQEREAEPRTVTLELDQWVTSR